MYACICMYACMCTNEYARARVCVHACIHVRVFECMHAWVYKHLAACVCVYSLQTPPSIEVGLAGSSSNIEKLPTHLIRTMIIDKGLV